ncbi:IL-6 subfamily cytokine M17 [Brienomyrus brachyistius]|uniref:IL-6 subfamily cytokine M17 n=1 Tax=Brienomyrus brachyistius TaxID=42636 RepID=UPI0020B3EDED|nr:IL-6 subfamily cytokine M17 [Brienomyrus brachyistius]
MMPGHSYRLLPSAQQAVALWLVLLVYMSRAAACRSEANSVLLKSIMLADLMRKDAGELRRTYIRRHGDFTKSFCQMPVDNAPDPEITGFEPAEKLQSIYTKLKLFQEHLAAVREQQTQLQDPSNSLLSKLRSAGERLGDLAGNVKTALQCLKPNELITVSSISDSPRNTFQQKMYGCVVLTRHKEFLSRVHHELKNLRNKVGR